MTTNLPFLTSLSLRGDDLQHAQFTTLPAIPSSAAPALDAVYTDILEQMTQDLDNDTATTAFYAVARLIFAPVPGTTAPADLGKHLRTRCSDLRNGAAAALWTAYPWETAHLMSTTISNRDDAELSTVINKDIARAAPATGFRRLTTAPFVPTTDKAAEVVFSKVVSTPNQDHSPEQLPSLATNLLPQQPFGDATITDDKQKRQTITFWQKHLQHYKRGAPDGTGLRTAHLLVGSDSIDPSTCSLAGGPLTTQDHTGAPSTAQHSNDGRAAQAAQRRPQERTVPHRHDRSRHVQTTLPAQQDQNLHW